jgi:methionyl-tRNA synthetase
MIDLDAWLSGSCHRNCETRRSGGYTYVTLRDEHGQVFRVAGETREEAEEKALRRYGREQTEARAQVDIDDAEFLRTLGAT